MGLFNSQRTISFVLLLFYLCFLPVSAQQCVEYVLKNECSSLVGNVSIVEESEQQDFFDEYVSLNVSNVRMVPEWCRRPYLSYLCQLMFGSFYCGSSSNEEQHCLEEQYCLQVSDLCSDYFQLDCTFSFSPSPSPSLNCSEEVKEQIEEVKKKPIKVETCLDGLKEEIECCPDPFIFDDNDECVVECPQYFYGESMEKWIRIFSLVFVSLGIFIIIISVLPLSVLSTLRYPNYVLFVCFGSFLTGFLLNNISTFSGGYVSYLCGGENNFYAALDRFSSSMRSIVTFAFMNFFDCYAFTHWLLFSFNLFCYSMRPYSQMFEKFIVQPVSPAIMLLMEGGCLVVSIGNFIASLLLGSHVFFIPIPTYGLPFPLKKGALLELYSYPLYVCQGLSCIFLVCALGFILRRGTHIIYYQWRSLVAGGFWILVVILSTILDFLSYSPLELENYIGCVASHPQKSPPPCHRQYSRPFYIMFYELYVIIMVDILMVIIFWTNSLVVQWWKVLIFERKFSCSLDLNRSLNEESRLINQ